MAVDDAMRLAPATAASAEAMTSCFINDDLQQRPAWFPPATACKCESYQAVYLLQPMRQLGHPENCLCLSYKHSI